MTDTCFTSLTQFSVRTLQIGRECNIFTCISIDSLIQFHLIDEIWQTTEFISAGNMQIDRGPISSDINGLQLNIYFPIEAALALLLIVWLYGFGRCSICFVDFGKC